MSNGEILDALEKKINLALQNKRLTEKERTLLDIVQLFVLFLQDDHKKMAAIAPQVSVLWSDREQSKMDRMDFRRMWMSPLINILVTTGVSVILSALLFYFLFLSTMKGMVIR